MQQPQGQGEVTFLIVTLGDIVHCLEPGTHPGPSVKGTARCPQTWALQRGACPQAPAIYKSALGKAVSPQSTSCSALRPGVQGPGLHYNARCGSCSRGPSPSRPSPTPGLCAGRGLQTVAGKAELNSSNRELAGHKGWGAGIAQLNPVPPKSRGGASSLLTPGAEVRVSRGGGKESAYDRSGLGQDGPWLGIEVTRAPVGPPWCW